MTSIYINIILSSTLNIIIDCYPHWILLKDFLFGLDVGMNIFQWMLRNGKDNPCLVSMPQEGEGRIVNFHSALLTTAKIVGVYRILFIPEVWGN